MSSIPVEIRAFSENFGLQLIPCSETVDVLNLSGNTKFTNFRANTPKSAVGVPNGCNQIPEEGPRQIACPRVCAEEALQMQPAVGLEELWLDQWSSGIKHLEFSICLDDLPSSWDSSGSCS